MVFQNNLEKKVALATVDFNISNHLSENWKEKGEIEGIA